MCHPAYTKECGHVGWCACVKHRSYEDAVQSLGYTPRDTQVDPLHRPHRSRSTIRVGSESPHRRLEGPDLDVRQGDRVIVRGRYKLGVGVADGPVTLDNEGYWQVTFTPEDGLRYPYADCFDYHLLERVYEL